MCRGYCKGAKAIDFPHTMFKCDVIKINLVKLWDLSGYSKKTVGLLAKNWHANGRRFSSLIVPQRRWARRNVCCSQASQILAFGGNYLWDISPVMLKWHHKNPSKFDLFHKVKNQVKFRKICMESSEKKSACISETISFSQQRFRT